MSIERTAEDKERFSEDMKRIAEARLVAAASDLIAALWSVKNRLAAWIDVARMAQISSESRGDWDGAKAHGNTISNYEALVSIIDLALEAATESKQ